MDTHCVVPRHDRQVNWDLLWRRESWKLPDYYSLKAFDSKKKTLRTAPNLASSLSTTNVCAVENIRFRCEIMTATIRFSIRNASEC